jgi:hypothetical protein
MAGATLTAATLLALVVPAIANAGQVRPGVGDLSGPFVALGDSFAAGNLIPSSPAGTPAGCLRSSHDYGADAAAMLGVATYVDATCTGAATASMTQPEPVLLGTLVPFAFGDVPYLRGIEVDLNQMLARTAAANGATFVDTYQATVGHDACTGASTKDVESLVPTSLAYPFHPNQRGELVMAQQVVAALSS